MGASAADLISVKLGGTSSESVRWVSHNVVKATFTNIESTFRGLGPQTFPTFNGDEITITTRGGEMTGPHLQPLTLIKSKSGRPVIIDSEVRTSHIPIRSSIL